jgi:CHAD domain-containing protein
VTALATLPDAGIMHLDLDTSVQLGGAETLAVGVKRVALDQFEHAASGFFDGEDVFPMAVHEARKSLKRVRALLRLLQGELEGRVFRFEDRTLRDTGRMLASVRSSTSMLAVAGLIKDLYGDLLAPDTFDGLIARLARRRDLVLAQAMEDPHLVIAVVRSLERAHGRYASWPTDPDAREIYGMGVRDRYESIGPGLGDTYSTGRHEMVTAYTHPTAHNFHQWRKRVKYLRHQMEFLVPLWPEVIAGTAVTLDRLGFVLGEDHDLAELGALVTERPELCPDPAERSLLHALVRQRQVELRFAAEVMGRRVYAEKPGSLRARFGEYWEGRRLSISLPSPAQP